MFLQVVSLTRNVRLDSLAVAELDTGDLTLGRVGLLRLRNEDVAHDTPLLRVVVQQRRRRHLLALLVFPARRLVERDERGRRGVERTQEVGCKTGDGRRRGQAQHRGERPGRRRQRRRGGGPRPLDAGERPECGEHRWKAGGREDENGRRRQTAQFTLSLALKWHVLRLSLRASSIKPIIASFCSIVNSIKLSLYSLSLALFGPKPITSFLIYFSFKLIIYLFIYYNKNMLAADLLYIH